MNRGRMFRGRAATRVDRLQEAAADSMEKVRDQASVLAEQAREGLARGGEALRAVERAVFRNVQENRSFYLAALVAVVGLFIAKRLVDRSRN